MIIIMATNSGKGASNGNNIISWLIGLFTGGNDPERGKRRLLQQIAKELTRGKYKFYRPRGNQALPGLGKFFYGIYKITVSASSLLQNSQSSQALRGFCIEAYMTEEQKTLAKEFDEATIRESAKTLHPKVHAAKLKESIASFFGSFDSSVVNLIDENYSQILRLIDFVNYDYYFVLKKFDASFTERNVTSTPKLEAINGDYISDDLKDFLEVLLPLGTEADWDKLLDILSTYKGLEVFNRQSWSRLMNALKNVTNSGILTMMVQHLDMDPYWKPKIELKKVRIMETYLDTLQSKTEKMVKKILSEQKNAQVEKLCIAIFGANPPSRMKNYTDKANIMFNKKLNVSYIYTIPINYLKTFLLDYFKKDVRELKDMLLVQGKWSTNVASQAMADAFYKVTEVSEQLVKFDEDLNEKGNMGSRLKRAVSRVVDRDPGTGKGVQVLVQEANEMAIGIINKSAGNLIGFANNLKNLLQDVDRQDYELIINWKELDSITDVPIKTHMAEVYKKIYYFIQLIQMFLKPGSKRGAGSV